MSVTPTLHLLTGPTAVGKTELSLQCAEQNNAEIVSCDSLLFYRGMDIGTAKPTPEELARVPHHLIDTNEVREAMSIADYVGAAQACVADIVARGKNVLVTGGSGFYLKAFVAPVVDSIEIPPALRTEIDQRLAQDGLTSLVAELRALNPEGLDGLDVDNSRRVTRGLERCLASGRTLVSLKAEFRAQPSAFADYHLKGVCLERDTEELRQRIELRVHQMIADGLKSEVETLLSSGLLENPSAARSIGYRETIALLNEEIATSEWAPLIIKNTKTLMRKQRTWFRSQLPEFVSVAAAEARPDGLFDSV